MINTTHDPGNVLVWDQHVCLPLRTTADLDQLELYRKHGVDYVSVNVGFDAISWDQALQVALSFRAQVIDASDRYVLATSIDDVQRAKRDGRLAVTFDLEGTEPLDGHPALLETFWRIGVRTISMTYNETNRAGGGCHDDPRVGLTKLGRRYLALMNELGVMVDATHCSVRTALDLCSSSTSPVVYSHSVPMGAATHPRNITDEQMRACAATGGVVGVNGVGVFLGAPRPRPEDLFRAVDYAVQMIGPDHVGLGLDYVFDLGELDDFFTNNPTIFPPNGDYALISQGPEAFAGPEQLVGLVGLLQEHDYPSGAVAAILGGNFQRVARQVWRG